MSSILPCSSVKFSFFTASWYAFHTSSGGGINVVCVWSIGVACLFDFGGRCIFICLDFVFSFCFCFLDSAIFGFNATVDKFGSHCCASSGLFVLWIFGVVGSKYVLRFVCLLLFTVSVVLRHLLGICGSVVVFVFVTLLSTFVPTNFA